MAVMILGVVAVLIYSSFARSLEIPQYVRDLQERYQTVRQAMNRITREIGMAYLSKHVNPQVEEHPRYLFRVVRQGDDSRLDFTAFAHQKMYENADESDQCEIGYFLEEDPEISGVKHLMRREQKRIDHQPGSGGPKEIACPDVKRFTVRAFNELDKEFVEEWDTSKVEQYDRLPRIVEITLTVEDEFGQETTFYTKAKVNPDPALGLQQHLRHGGP